MSTEMFLLYFAYLKAHKHGTQVTTFARPLIPTSKMLIEITYQVEKTGDLHSLSQFHDGCFNPTCLAASEILHHIRNANGSGDLKSGYSLFNNYSTSAPQT